MSAAVSFVLGFFKYWFVQTRDSGEGIDVLLTITKVGLLILGLVGYGLGLQTQEETLQGLGIFLALIFFLLLPYLQYRKQQEAMIPRFAFPDGKDSISTITASRNFPMLGTCTVTFFGFKIVNTGILPIEECQARLVKLETPKEGAWTGSSLLCFEPESKIEAEPINSVTLPGKTKRGICLCSVKEGGVIFCSSLSMNWRGEGWFDSMFADDGDYIFTVQLSGKGTAPKETHFVFTFKDGVKGVCELKHYTEPST